MKPRPLHDFGARPRPPGPPSQFDSPLRWTVPSASKAGESHLVQLDSYGGNGGCSCPDFVCRLEPNLRRQTPPTPSEGTRCKHIRYVRSWFLDRVILQMAETLRNAGKVGAFILAAVAGAAPSPAFLDSLAWAESRNDPTALGDFDRLGQPQARGAYQMHLGAWIDCQTAFGGRLGAWDTLAHCPATSRAAAAAYLGQIEARLRRDRLTPTPTRLWLAWSLGYSGAKRIGFNPAYAPATKRRGLARLLDHLAGRPATL